jgi:plasmid maintenance system antidote protein VapI
LDLSITSVAQTLGITRAALSAFLNERAAPSPEMMPRID